MGVTTRSRLLTCSRLTGIVMLMATAAALAGAGSPANLLTNGAFEKGVTKDGEPVGWHTKITSVTPIPEYRDPENKKGRTGVMNFKCGCEHDWGTVRPWVGLHCVNCGRLHTGLEDSSAYYMENENWVQLVPGRRGQGIGFDMPQEVGDVQGARIFSDLIKVDRSAGYEIAFDAISEKPHIRVFVEGFKLVNDDEQATEWVKTLSRQCNPLKQRHRLQRSYRRHVNAQTPGRWQHFSEQFAQPKSDRYHFDYMMVNIYAYLPGKAVVDNVVLRRLSAKELQAYREANPGPREKRLRE